VRRALRLSVFEGMAYALMVGLGEAYFLAYAIRLGASTLETGLTVALPLCVGSIGPLIALKLFARIRARRALALAAVCGQMLTLFALAALDYVRAATPLLLIASSCFYQVFGQAAGTAWSSWYGDLVPAAIRGRYFASRNRGVHVATFVGLVVGGSLLQVLEPSKAADAAGSASSGFVVVFVLAGLCRMASAALLWASYEPRFHGLPDRVRVFRFLRTLRGAGVRRMLLIGCAFQLTVYLSSAYFAPFMLEELRFSYIEYMGATLAVVLFKIVSLPAWGRLIDTRGPRGVLAVAAVLVSLVPGPWLAAKGLGLVVLAQAFSGLSWGGYEVSQFSYMLASSYKRMRPHVFAAQSVLNGMGQLCGALVGAALLEMLGGFRMIFALSLVARLAVATALAGTLPAPPSGQRPRPAMRLAGARPSGGIVFRPIEGEAGGEDEVRVSAQGGANRASDGRR
jgi:MFS family permease